jgi:hypothetical protein
MFNFKSRHFWLNALAAVFLLVCFFSTGMQAQNISTAQLNGTVHDQTGAVIPNAAVTITDESKGFSRSATSDAQGNYRLLLLPPGTYTVKATAPGFNTYISKDVILTTGEQGELPLSLSVGTTQIVTVSSGADIIETQRSSQSTTVELADCA